MWKPSLETNIRKVIGRLVARMALLTNSTATSTASSVVSVPML